METYLTTFFQEKALDNLVYEIEGDDGMLHLVPTELVIERILDAPKHEQEAIANILRKIDFLNGNVHHFLQHLAKALVKNH